jgi:integrase
VAGDDRSRVGAEDGATSPQTLAQIVDEAVKMSMLVGNPVRSVKPPKVVQFDGTALDIAETQALLAAASEHRLAAAVALLFLQGWRVSEALGLAWEDVDLAAARRGYAGPRSMSTARGSSSGRRRTTARRASTG